MLSKSNLEVILWSLEELSDPREQERLWLATGGDGGEVSSPVEVVEQLFTDSGLRHALEWAWRQRRGGRDVPDTTVFTHDIDRRLIELGELLRKLPSGSPEQVIASPAMCVIRTGAAALLSDLRKHAQSP